MFEVGNCIFFYDFDEVLEKFTILKICENLVLKFAFIDVIILDELLADNLYIILAFNFDLEG